MFKKIRTILFCSALYSLSTLQSLPLSSLRGFEPLFSIDSNGNIPGHNLHPMIGNLGKTVVDNIYLYGNSTTPLSKVVKKMFHQINPFDPILPTKKGFYGEISLYQLGQFAAFVAQDTKTIDNYLKQINKKNKIETPFHLLAKNLSLNINLVAEELGYLNNITKNATTSKNISQAEKITIPLYDPQMSLILFNALAVARATSKTEYLEFLKGFYDHCTDEQKKWFNDNALNSIATKEWEELRYTKNDLQALYAKEFKNPSDWDLLYASLQQNNPIEWQYISFTDPNKKEIKVGDCCETGVWAILQLILSPEVSTEFSSKLLPVELQTKKHIVDFIKRFSDQDINNPRLRKEQFFILSSPNFKEDIDKKSIIYNTLNYYELKPSLQNIRHALNYLFGINAEDFKTLGEMLSSEKQTIEFSIKKDALEEDLGDIIITVTNTGTKEDRSITLSVTKSHVQITSQISLATKKAPKSILEKNYTKIAPSLSALFYEKELRFNLFRLFSGNELNNIYRIWKEQDKKYELAQKQIIQLIDFNKVIYQDGDFDKDVILLLIQNANKTPFKEAIKNSNPDELLRMVVPLVSNIEALIPFLNRSNPNWRTDEICIKNLWKRLRYNNKFVEALLKNPAHELTKSITAAIPLSKVADIIWEKTGNLDTLTTFLDTQTNNWKTDKDFIKALWKKLQFEKAFIEALSKNPAHELTKSLTVAIPLSEVASQIWYAIEDLDTLTTFLDAQTNNWRTDKDFIKALWKELKDSDSFENALAENPEYELTKSLVNNNLFILSENN